jgi:hypothetical protein
MVTLNHVFVQVSTLFSKPTIFSHFCVFTPIDRFLLCSGLTAKIVRAIFAASALGVPDLIAFALWSEKAFSADDAMFELWVKE